MSIVLTVPLDRSGSSSPLNAVTLIYIIVILSALFYHLTLPPPIHPSTLFWRFVTVSLRSANNKHRSSGTPSILRSADFYICLWPSMPGCLRTSDMTRASIAKVTIQKYHASVCVFVAQLKRRKPDPILGQANYEKFQKQQFTNKKNKMWLKQSLFSFIVHKQSLLFHIFIDSHCFPYFP